MISVSPSFCFCDRFAAEQAASSDGSSSSLVGKVCSFLTNLADLCFHWFFLTMGVDCWVSDVATVSVCISSDPETLSLTPLRVLPNSTQ